MCLKCQAFSPLSFSVARNPANHAGSPWLAAQKQATEYMRGEALRKTGPGEGTSDGPGSLLPLKHRKGIL